jgi:hypothetical protein
LTRSIKEEIPIVKDEFTDIMGRSDEKTRKQEKREGEGKQRLNTPRGTKGNGGPDLSHFRNGEVNFISTGSFSVSALRTLRVWSSGERVERMST